MRRRDRRRCILDGIDERLSACDYHFPVHAGGIQRRLSDSRSARILKTRRPDSHRRGEHKNRHPCGRGSSMGMEARVHRRSSHGRLRKNRLSEIPLTTLLENAYYVITPNKRVSRREQDRQDDTGIAAAIGAIPLVLDCQQHDLFRGRRQPSAPSDRLQPGESGERQRRLPEQTMKRLAAGGFKDITRIASSSPVMWEQICMTNRGQHLRSF